MSYSRSKTGFMSYSPWNTLRQESVYPLVPLLHQHVHIRPAVGRKRRIIHQLIQKFVVDRAKTVHGSFYIKIFDTFVLRKRNQVHSCNDRQVVRQTDISGLCDSDRELLLSEEEIERVSLAC